MGPTRWRTIVLREADYDKQFNLSHLLHAWTQTVISLLGASWVSIWTHLKMGSYKEDRSMLDKLLQMPPHKSSLSFLYLVKSGFHNENQMIETRHYVSHLHRNKIKCIKDIKKYKKIYWTQAVGLFDPSLAAWHFFFFLERHWRMSILPLLIYLAMPSLKE